MYEGSCLCGQVKFTVNAFMSDPVLCHCKQCRRQSGHTAAASHAPKGSVTFSKNESLVWYRSSSEASRGFCAKCGANLFWCADQDDEIYVLMGALDATKELKLEGHIWVAGKGDYYEIADGLPQEKGS